MDDMADSPLDWHEYHSTLAALSWQLELGVDTCVQDTPVNHYEVPKEPEPAAPLTRAVPQTSKASAVSADLDPVTQARQAAQSAHDLASLRAALAAYPHCELRKGAANLVFADGVAGARVMIIGEVPAREEDQAGRPFVGQAGQLLDRMLGAIDLDRRESVYITSVLPWRPPQNRDPRPDEIAMITPFLRRHIALAAPEFLLLMGNTPCQALLARRGIARLRGTWSLVDGVPAMPMFHPEYLLRNPGAKRETWADLLSLMGRLRGD